MENSFKVNLLNDLSSKEWFDFTKSWFLYNKKELSEELMEEFILFFTKKGALVFDPFLSKGTTLEACHKSKRNGVGIANEKYQEVKERLKQIESQLHLSADGFRQECKQLVIQGEAENFAYLWQQYQLPKIDFVITSPKLSDNHQQNLDKLIKIFEALKPQLRDGAYLTVILDNFLVKGKYVPFAWDFAKKMSLIYQFCGERILAREQKNIYLSGYKYGYFPSIQHKYCLIFKKVEENGPN